MIGLGRYATTEDNPMVNTPEQISPELARQLIRDGNTDQLNTDPHAVDALNQSVIEEFPVHERIKLDR